MLGLALTFFLLAIVAAILGFSGIASSLAGIAQILFVVFMLAFLISVIVNAFRGRTPPA